MKNLWIGMLALVMAFCFGSCKEKSEQPAGDATEQVAETPSLEDIVAKAKAESANWTADDWKANMKAAMVAVAPMLKKVGELMGKMEGDDPAKAAEMQGELTKLQEEFAPMEKLMDELDSICDASEIGKTVMADTVWEKQVKEELGIPDL